MSLTIYGIKACDTMKKAFTWLDSNTIDYQFHDYKKAGISEQKLHAWCEALGWENVINRRGTSWRKIPEAERERMTQATAIAAAIANPSLIKRPLLEGDQILELGFDPLRWQTLNLK